MELDPDRYARLQDLFTEARKLDGSAREAFVASVDPGLRPKLQELLGADLPAEPGTPAGDPFSDTEIRAQRERMESIGDAPVEFPARIGSFEIIRRIGEGGMGTVFEARQARPARRVALKVLRSPLASAEQIARFEREAEWLGRLHHPGIAQVFEAGTFELGTASQPYLVLEFVDGPDVLTYASRAGLGRRQRLSLLARVCEAVEHAHASGVLHRDLKPDNVLVDEHGQPKLLDFGISRSIGGGDTLGGTLTGDGQVLGTVGYMAPEQLDPEIGSLGPAADVYALGVIGYELVTGRRPIDLTGLGISQILKAVATAVPPPPSTADRALRGDVDTMLGKALEREPGRRYGSAAGLAADLRRHLDDLPIHARPPTRAYRLKKYLRRQRALAAVLGALVLGLAGTLGFAIDARQQGRAARAAALAEADAKAALLQTLYGAESRLATAAMTKPGGLANVARHLERWRPRSGEVQLGWEFELLEGLLDEPRVSVPSTGTLRAVDIDPERGRMVVGAPAALEVRDTATLELLARLEPVDAQTLDVAFSPDGTRVAASFLFGPMAVWDIESGERLWVHDVEDDEAAWVAWNAEHDLVLRGGFGDTVRGLDAVTGVERWREDSYTRPDGQSFEMAPDGERFAAAHGDGILIGYVREDGLEVVQRIGNKGRPKVVSWSADGGRVAFGGWSGDVGVWRLEPQRLELLERVHTDWVNDVSFGPDARFVASASRDNSAAVVGVHRGRLVRRFADENRNVHRTQWADGERLIVTGDRPALEVWDWGGRGAFVRGWLLENPVQQSPVQLQARGDGGGFDAVCAHTHVAFDVQHGPPRGDAPRVRAHTFARSEDGAFAATVANGRLRVLDGEGAALPGLEFDVEVEDEYCSAWSPAGPRRLALSNRTTLRVLDVGTGTLTGIGTYAEAFSAVTWSRDGAWVLLASAPGVVRRIDPATGEVHATLDLGVAAQAMAVSPDGRRLALGTIESSSVLLVDTISLEVEATLAGHTDRVYGVAWHPGGARLATGGEDGILRIWDVDRGELVGRIDTEERIGALAWSRDGVSLVAVTVSGSILCWSIELE